MNTLAFLRGYMSKAAAAGFSTLPEAVSAQQAEGGDPKSSSEMTIDKPKGKIKAKGKAADTLAANPTTVDSVSADVPPPPPKEEKPKDQQEVALGDVPQDLPPELQPPPQGPEGVV